MFLRQILRPFVNPQFRVNTLRLSSNVSFTSNDPEPSSANEDLPIEMPNPFQKEKTKCILCKHDIEPDYKNVKLLSQFQSPFTGRIYGRHITGLCKKMQRKVEAEIIKAQNIAFMGYYHKDVGFLKDPKLFDPERPIRPHKY